MKSVTRSAHCAVMASLVNGDGGLLYKAVISLGDLKWKYFRILLVMHENKNLVLIVKASFVPGLLPGFHLPGAPEDVCPQKW